jgi:aminoglycoside phosphotransferase (APT) family kinase protein
MSRHTRANQVGARPPAEVIALAARAVAGTDRGGRLIARDRLKSRVHRLHFETDDGIGTAIVKRLWARRAARAVELALRRWLPEVGLGWACPRLLGALGDPSDGEVWHVYEDVGGVAVDSCDPDPAQLEPIVELLAELHDRFTDHRLLAECRAHGEELGTGFFTSQVAACIDALRGIPASVAEQRDARERLLERVERLHRERDRRLAVAAAHAGPDTLLHGDLWTTNTLLVETARGPVPRLIDWDHVGVGPVAYDLSTFLYRFPAASRPAILSAYREAAARRGRPLPSDAELNLLFDTAEQARYACCLTTPARAAARGERWAFPHLAEIDDWFARLKPVLHEAEIA